MGRNISYDLGLPLAHDIPYINLVTQAGVSNTKGLPRAYRLLKEKRACNQTPGKIQI